MTDEKQDEILALLKKMDGETGRSLVSHKEALARHEANFAAQFKKLEEMAELLNRHTTLIDVCRGLVLSMWKHLGLPEPDQSTPSVN
jgi:hypothetical protein